MREGMERATETSQRWAGCTQTGNPLPFVTAIVASNPGDLGQGRVRCSSTGASRSDSFEIGALKHKLHAISASGIEYCKSDCTCQYPKSGE
jgi:hypothetical protein